MRASRAGNWRQYFIGAWMLVVCCTTTVEAATVAGVVRDVHGNPIDGAQIKIICEQSAENSTQVTSGKDGSYRFVELVPGKCQLSAERSGFHAGAPTVVTLSSALASVVSDFSLSQLSQEGIVTTSQPKLKFEASGIRGLIDPGGYSAPANAAAASGLISGVADIRRTENAPDFVASKDLPCRLQPELTKSATENPQNADANRRLGEFYLAHGSANQAIPYLKRARQIDGDDSRTIRDLSEALVASGQFNAAYEMLSLLSETQKDADYHQHLARAEEGLGQFTQAAEEYRLATEKDPSEENSFGVGYELILAGQFKDAAKAFNIGLARHSSSIPLLIGAGASEFLEGHGPVAVKLFLQAADLNPSDPRPYSFLAEAFGTSGAQVKEVRASLKRHLELSPADGEAYYLYGLALLHGNAEGSFIDNNHVESLLKQAIALDPSLAKAHFQLGTLYAHWNDYESATREFEAAVQLAPDMKEAHYRLASAYKKTGRPGAAEREMQSFRDTGDLSKPQNGESEISIEQFISVVARPGHTAANEMQCETPLNSGRSTLPNVFYQSFYEVGIFW